MLLIPFTFVVLGCTQKNLKHIWKYGAQLLLPINMSVTFFLFNCLVKKILEKFKKWNIPRAKGGLQISNQIFNLQWYKNRKDTNSHIYEAENRAADILCILLFFDFGWTDPLTEDYEDCCRLNCLYHPISNPK